MVRIQNMRLNDFSRLYSLFRCHRIRLVDRQEGYIDILYLFHFRDIFRVSGNVNPGAAHSEDISVVTSLWDGIYLYRELYYKQVLLPV